MDHIHAGMQYITKFFILVNVTSLLMICIQSYIALKVQRVHPLFLLRFFWATR